MLLPDPRIKKLRGTTLLDKARFPDLVSSKDRQPTWAGVLLPLDLVGGGESWCVAVTSGHLEVRGNTAIIV